MQQSNWKAWVDTMPGGGGDKRPTLHVSGTIRATGKANYQLRPTEPQPITPTLRQLEVFPEPTEGSEEFPIKFQEPINDANQYSQVHVIIGNYDAVTIEVEQVSAMAK